MQTVGHGNDDSSKSPKVLSPSHDEGRCNRPLRSAGGPHSSHSSGPAESKASIVGGYHQGGAERTAIVVYVTGD
jgi:hypothetical protein